MPELFTDDFRYIQNEKPDFSPWLQSHRVFHTATAAEESLFPEEAFESCAETDSLCKSCRIS